MLGGGGSRSYGEVKRLSLMQLSQISDTVVYPPSQKSRRIFINQRVPTKTTRCETEPDDIKEFRASFLALGTETGHPNELLSQMKEKVPSLGSNTTKNIQRLSLTRPPVVLDDLPLSQTMYKPVSSDTLNPMESKFIDDNFPNPATSRTTNKLPLPTDEDFGKPYKDRARSMIVPGRNELVESHSDLLLQMYKHVDRSHTRVVAPTRKSAFQDDTLQVYWALKPTTGSRPESREGASMCMIDRKLYLFGGQSMTKRNDLRVLNTDNWGWTMLQTDFPPKGRIGHTLVAYRNQLVLYGGWSHYSQRLRLRRCFKKLYLISLDQEIRWQRFRGTGKVPKSRRYHSAAVLGTSMLIYGGVDAQSKVLKGVSILEIDSLTWRKPGILTDDTPGPRSNCSLTPVFHPSVLYRSDFSVLAMPKPKINEVMPNSGFYMFGGLNEKSRATGDLWALTVYDGALAWRRVETQGRPPLPRSDHSAVLIGGYLVIFGGRNDDLYPSTGDSCIRDLSFLRIQTLHWETIRTFGAVPEGRWGHCAAAYGSRMLVLGGINTKAFLPSEIYLLETEQPFVVELVRQDTAKEAVKAARFAEVRRSSILK